MESKHFNIGREVLLRRMQEQVNRSIAPESEVLDSLRITMEKLRQTTDARYEREGPKQAVIAMVGGISYELGVIEAADGLRSYFGKKGISELDPQAARDAWLDYGRHVRHIYFLGQEKTTSLK